MSYLRFVVTTPFQGLRVDQALARLTNCSRRQIKRDLDAGKVRHNGKVLRVQSRTLRMGDVLDYAVDGSVQSKQTDRIPEVKALFEDPWLLAVDKGAGILSQPAQHRQGLAMNERVLLWLGLREGRRPHLHLMHRLDRATSGVLLFARHPDVQAPLAALWRKGEVRREYLAWVGGEASFDSVTVTEPIGRDPHHDWKFRTHPKGKSAQTEIEVVARRPAHTGLRAWLQTGRTHQVRVHLESLGLPVVGDRLYGGEAHDRLLLHAHRLEMTHPMEGSLLSIQSPVPFESPMSETQRSPTVRVNS